MRTRALQRVSVVSAGRVVDDDRAAAGDDAIGVYPTDGQVVHEAVGHLAEVADVPDGCRGTAGQQDAVADADVLGVRPTLAVDPEGVVRGGRDRLASAIDA